MTKYLLFFFLIFLNISIQASNKDEIIKNIKKTENFSFNFKQTINNKTESGNCIIQYPKKIYCEYNNIKKKIIVSNGISLIINNRNSGTFYSYPLNKTPLIFLLDKDYLIKKITISKTRIIENKYISFRILENNNEINIFFDNKTFNLIGWQTLDVYQNLSITFISSIKVNEKINDSLFLLPKKDWYFILLLFLF